jgi:hypothetical protein
MLRGGVDAWVADVLNPTLPYDAPADRERVFADIAELSRYFGGVPRRVLASDASASPAEDASDPAETLRRTLRRGC